MRRFKGCGYVLTSAFLGAFFLSANSGAVLLLQTRDPASPPPATGNHVPPAANANCPVSTLSFTSTIYNGFAGEMVKVPFTACSSSLRMNMSAPGLPPNAHIDSLGDNRYQIIWTPTVMPQRTWLVTVTVPNGSGAPLSQQLVFNRVGWETLQNQTLVLFNTNSTVGSRIADYYSAARNIPKSHVCGVQAPVGVYGKDKHVVSVRKQIIENCICPLFPTNLRPTPCDVTNNEAVGNVSPITHLVFTKDLPSRILNPPLYTWLADPLGPQDPSFDHFISRMLYRNIDPFTVPTPNTGTFPKSSFWILTDALTGHLQQSYKPLDGYIREVIPAQDRIVAYGRVEAYDVERTYALIDRTMAAEQEGMKGHVYSELPIPYASTPTSQWGRMTRLFDSRAQECFAYVNSPLFVPGSLWNPEVCRVGFTSGQIPGENYGAGPFFAGRMYSAAEVARPFNASLFFGTNSEPNGHSAFDGFQNMLNWRKTADTCTPLCKDLPTDTEKKQCRSTSHDVFHEINTNCVGGGADFMGHQMRSWTVKNYGFFPPGWSVFHVDGKYDGIAPFVRTGGGFKSAAFVDDSFLSFDAPTQKIAPECVLANGSVESCPSFHPINFGKQVALQSFTTDSQTQWTLTFRYRAPSLATYYSGAYFYASFTIYFTDSTYANHLVQVPLTGGQALWTPVTLTLTPPSGKTVSSLAMRFTSEESGGIRGRVDLDGFELQGFPTSVVNAFVNPSFADPMINNVADGDYAANAIDRLGAIAWWGSMNHYEGGGLAFNDALKFLGARFSGRTLGETLVYSGANGAISGTIYGDPLYRSTAAQIWLQNMDSNTTTGALVPVAGVPLLISAANGLGSNPNTQKNIRWNVSVCASLNVDLCDGGMWQEMASGDTAVHHLVVDFLTREKLLQLAGSNTYTLRLEVSSLDMPLNHRFHSYLHVRVN